jgi:zinc protease
LHGFALERLCDLAFRVHPYRWPVIGLAESLLAMSIADVRRFYRDHYSPNNACAVIVGDIGYAAAVDLLDSAFSPVPPRALPARDIPEEPEQTQQRSARFERPIAAPLVVVGYKSPPLSDPESLHVRLLAFLLANGASSRLSRRLVEDRRVASWVNAFGPKTRDPFLVSFAIQPARGVEPEAVIEELDSELAQLVSRGPDDSDVLRAINGLQTQLWIHMEDTDKIAYAVGEYETIAGDFRRLPQRLDRIPGVDAHQLWKTARQYFAPSRRSIVTLVPGGAA